MITCIQYFPGILEVLLLTREEISREESIFRVILEILWKKRYVVANTTMFSHFIEEQHDTDKCICPHSLDYICHVEHQALFIKLIILLAGFYCYIRHSVLSPPIMSQNFRDNFTGSVTSPISCGIPLHPIYMGRHCIK